MIEFILQIEPKVAKSHLMLSQLKEAQQKALHEKGCLCYEIFINNNIILLHEKWENQECLDIHLSLDYLKDLKQSMRENLIKNFNKFILSES